MTARGTVDTPAETSTSGVDDQREEPIPRPEVHRLRDLDRRGRLAVAAFAAALLLAPVLAFAWAAPDWIPANDPALMGLQALAVGSSDTPLTGQPSTSAHYVDESRHVDHPGPLHFYLLAGPMRVLGVDIGMLSVSLLINAACLLIAAWVVFRRLGPLGGMLGAVILGLISFTTGAANLVDPVSSDIARMPLLCSAVLIWSLLCGDIRLLPLTTGVVSFAAQQHLSVLPAIAVLTVAGVIGLLYVWGRNGAWWQRHAQGTLAVWGGWSAAIGLVLWSPVLLQQITGRPGNLTMLYRLTGDEERPTLGLGSAVRQVTHVLGLPPVLGRTELTGLSFLDDPSLFTWLSAGGVLAVLAGLGVLWSRNAPDRLAMVAMVAVLVIAGLINGANVLDSEESWRLIMYHWAFPLAFFVALSLSAGAATAVSWLVRYVPASRRAWAGMAGSGLSLAAIVVPSAVNPALDRGTNMLVAAHSPIERGYVQDLVNAVLAERGRVGDGPLLVVSEGAVPFSSVRESVTLYLVQKDLDARLTRSLRWYVPDKNLADREAAEAGLLIVEDYDPEWQDIAVGELIADVPTTADLDLAALERLLERFDGVDELSFGPAVVAQLDVLPTSWLRAAESGDLAAAMGNGLDDAVEPSGDRVSEQTRTLLRLYALRREPARYLLDRELLEFLAAHPLEEPRLDPVLIERVLHTAPDQLRAERPMRLRAYLLDRDELATVRDRSEVML